MPEGAVVGTVHNAFGVLRNGVLVFRHIDCSGTKYVNYGSVVRCSEFVPLR